MTAPPFYRKLHHLTPGRLGSGESSALHAGGEQAISLNTSIIRTNNKK